MNSSSEVWLISIVKGLTSSWNVGKKSSTMKEYIIDRFFFRMLVNNNKINGEKK